MVRRGWRGEDGGVGGVCRARGVGGCGWCVGRCLRAGPRRTAVGVVGGRGRGRGGGGRGRGGGGGSMEEGKKKNIR